MLDVSSTRIWAQLTWKSDILVNTDMLQCLTVTFQVPNVALTDDHTHFTYMQFTKLYACRNTMLLHSPKYHPKSKGAVERAVQIIAGPLHTSAFGNVTNAMKRNITEQMWTHTGWCNCRWPVTVLLFSKSWPYSKILLTNKALGEPIQPVNVLEIRHSSYIKWFHQIKSLECSKSCPTIWTVAINIHSSCNQAMQWNSGPHKIQCFYLPTKS